MGDDTVHQLDATTLATMTVFPVPLTRPRDLFFDGQGSVCVSASISGNNTFPARLRPAPGADPELRIWNGADSMMFPAGGLPDIDAVRLDLTSGTTTDLLRGTMSLVHESEINPQTGQLWTVGTNHDNTTPSTEPNLRGIFAINVATITDLTLLPASPTLTIAPDGPVGFGGLTTGTYPIPAPKGFRSLCNPTSIAIEPGSGNVWIGSEGGQVLGSFTNTGIRNPWDYLLFNPISDVLTGKVVRDLKVKFTLLAAYCQQTNNIIIWLLGDGSEIWPDASLNLGPDPSPDAIKRGRETFYGGEDSLFNKTSCASCHPGGGADGLTWDISDSPVDDKGPMVTQTLFGIEDSQPHHWRGERSLPDFNNAFPGLLGRSSKIPDADMKDLEAFIYSLRTPANTSSDNDRMIKDSLAVFDETDLDANTTLSGVGDATAGQNLFFDANTDLGNLGTCVTCHSMPTGSNGHFFPDPTRDQVGAREHFEPTQLNNQFALKDQPLVPLVTSNDGALRIQRTGSGMLHNGTVQNGLKFVAFFDKLSDPEKLAVNAFQRQIDTGTAQGVHHAVRYHAGLQSPGGATLPMGPLSCPTPANPTTVEEEVRCIIGHTGDGWNGAVAIGTYPHPTTGTLVRTSWWYDPLTATFRNADPATFPSQTWSDFYAATQAGADNVFMGLPPGNERRFATDFDHDQLDLSAEILAGTDPWNEDSDGDGAEDGNEVSNLGDPINDVVGPNDGTFPFLTAPVTTDFTTATGAKFIIRTNEPTRIEVTLYGNHGAPTVIEARPTFETLHTVTIGGLTASPAPIDSTSFVPGGVRQQVYSCGTVVLTDENGLTSSPLPLPSFQAKDATDSGGVIDAIGLSMESETGNRYPADLSITVGNPVSPTAAPMPGSFPAVGTTIFGPTLPGALFGVQVLRGVGDNWEIVDLADIQVNSGGIAVQDFTVLDPGIVDYFGSLTPAPGLAPFFVPSRPYSDVLSGPWILTDNIVYPTGNVTLNVTITRQVAGEELRFVPKFLGERLPDSTVYTFATTPFVFTSAAFPTDPSTNVTTLDIVGTFGFGLYNSVGTAPDKRDVTSSL